MKSRPYILSYVMLYLSMTHSVWAQPCSPPQTRVWIHAAENGSLSDTLWFGFDSTASCGVDAHLCEFEFWWPCGDPPGWPLFCAHWVPWCNPGSAPLIRHDYRSFHSTAQRDTFRVRTQVSYAATNMVLSWPAGLGNYFQALEMRHFNGSQLIITNMLTNTTVDITSSLGNPHVATIYSDGLVVSVGQTLPAVPERFALSQNYPNPFNPSTSISFTIPYSSFTTLKVFDVLGREVATLVDEVKQPGEYKVTWDAGNAASGVYYYRLHTGSSVSSRKMLLIR